MPAPEVHRDDTGDDWPVFSSLRRYAGYEQQYLVVEEPVRFGAALPQRFDPHAWRRPWKRPAEVQSLVTGRDDSGGADEWTSAPRDAEEGRAAARAGPAPLPLDNRGQRCLLVSSRPKTGTAFSKQRRLGGRYTRWRSV